MFQQPKQEYETSHYLEDVLKEVDIGTWEWNLNTDDVTWSENMTKFVGGHPVQGKLKTTRNRCISPIHEDDIGYVENEINNCIQKEKNLKVEYRVVWPDGSVHWVQSRGFVVRDNHENPSHMLGVMFDITPRKHMEQALNEARELAARQNKAKSEFLSRMSHELRTPLNAIVGFSELISLDTNINSEQKDYLRLIRKSGEHLSSLINEVLDLARIEAGKIELDIKLAGVKVLLSECIDLIQGTISKNEQKLFIDIGECEGEYVHVDRKRFIQVVLNLLSNAVKYNRSRGKIHVTCKPQGDRLRISVRDNGPGLSAEQQEQLFQPFQRLGTERSNIQGTGIGLVITKQLVELMDGYIGVNSKVGKGSTFWIECPRASSRDVSTLCNLRTRYESK
jgi:PAS domain S-box-containing protein